MTFRFNMSVGKFRRGSVFIVQVETSARGAGNKNNGDEKMLEEGRVYLKMDIRRYAFRERSGKRKEKNKRKEKGKNEPPPTLTPSVKSPPRHMPPSSFETVIQLALHIYTCIHRA